MIGGGMAARGTRAASAMPVIGYLNGREANAELEARSTEV
jgi:hypothetical protein